MDVFDRAQELEAKDRAAAISRALASIPRGPSRTHCAECGDPIPEARRRAVEGCTLCVTCQQKEDSPR